MDERSRSELLQRNEQIKAASTLAGNAGLTIAAAGAGQWFLMGLDEYALLWLLFGGALMWVSVKALVMIEAEM